MAFSRSITVVTCINSSFFLLKNMISLHGYPVLKITTHKLLDSECLHHSVALNDTSFSSHVLALIWVLASIIYKESNCKYFGILMSVTENFVN